MKVAMKKLLTLQNLRRIYAIFFVLLFVILIFLTNFLYLQGYEIQLFFDLDPLVAITTFFTGGTLYKGLVLSVFVIIGTLFLGRFFCSWICPLGIINHLISFGFGKFSSSESTKLNAYRKTQRIKYYILIFSLILAFFGLLQIGLLDPIALVTRSFIVSVFPAIQYWTGYLYLKQPLFQGGILIGVVFVSILLANRIIPRFWCRILCPLGALLGLLSIFSLFRIRRNTEKCNDCKKCLQGCQGACEPFGEIRNNECLLCMNCISNCPEGALHYGLATPESSIHKAIDIPRRRLIETTVVGLALYPILKTVANARTLPREKVIRPPGSIKEDDFLSKCIKCSECMKICPTNVLQPALLESGFEGLWTPVLKNRIGYCEHNCVLCGQVCPTGAITPLQVVEKVGKAPDIKPMKIGTAFYDRGRCLPWAMNIPCIVCEEVCPTSPKAIWFQETTIDLRGGGSKRLKQPLLDPSRCIGCGICENKCPVQDPAAIRVTSVGETRSTTNQMILNG